MMRKYALLTLALAIFLALPALASEPTDENAPIPTEEDIFLSDLPQLSEEELMEINGYSVIFSDPGNMSFSAVKVTETTKIGSKPIITELIQIFGDYYDTIYILYTPNGNIYGFVVEGIGGNTVIYTIKYDLKSGTTTIEVTVVSGTQIYTGCNFY